MGCYVLAFSQVILRLNGTEANVTIAFNQTTPAVQIPAAAEVQQTLVDAVTNTNATYNVTFQPNIIKVEVASVTTEAPTSNATVSGNTTTTTTPNSAANSTLGVTAMTPESATTNAANVTTNAISQATNASTTASSATNTATNASPTSSSATNTATNASITASSATNVVPTAVTTKPGATATTTTTTTTTAEAITIRQLRFRSAGETYSTDLGSPSSTAFINRAALIKSELEPYYRRPFTTFRSLNVISFSNGSIINIMNLQFVTKVAPNVTEIGKVLVEAAQNAT
ncbi:Y' element ATP-dependent helicase YJL225C, partial [Austrofundulus limnaeus]|uniref:Y' element ATP-dependent helicase YJL225C n=1 Tax=Austrofundulus limnaeus TaxID=52670 RepID=A0A2I4C4V5_AUSLI